MKAWKMLQLLTSKPVFYICNVDENSAATGNKFSDAVVAHAKAEGSAAVVISAKIESETAVLSDDEQKEFLESARPRRARPQPRHPRRLRTARPADLLHRRPEGSARLDDQERHDRPASGRRHPRRLREGLHQSRNHRLRRLREVQRRKRREGKRQGPSGRQGIHRPGRRRDALPLQRVGVVRWRAYFPKFEKEDPRDDFQQAQILGAKASSSNSSHMISSASKVIS